MTVKFNDLLTVNQPFAAEIEAAVARVLARGWYLLGPELDAFEAEFAAYHGVSHAVGVGNGTDAIELALRAGGVGPGDEVITVAHTAVATVCAIERSGATPVLVDIDPATMLIDRSAAAAAITSRTKAIVPVHLYGYPADMPVLSFLAEAHNLLLIEDCAQAHGATIFNRPVGTWGAMGAFSFYPTKNLGSCGDGGAVITNDSSLAARLRRLRNYGQTDRYHHAERGINSRLDEIQAAILRVKLAHLDAHNQVRRRLAAQYAQALAGLPLELTGHRNHDSKTHVYHLYVVRHPDRDWLRGELLSQGIETLAHYPIPVHRQAAYADLNYAEGSLPNTERAAREVLSLPFYVGLDRAQIDQVAAALARILQSEPIHQSLTHAVPSR
jgi:dTDP-4-amino-4,6-dideoxygalactose transaminase